MTPLTSGATARRMYGLVEPIGLIPYAAGEPAEALLALGLRNYWDTYFAGRAAPLGDLAGNPSVARAADLAVKAATRPRTEGRPLYAALRTLPAPEQPLARLWYAGNLLREHRGDGHVVALIANGIGGTEAHVLLALSQGMPAEKFGRVAHLPHAQLAAVVDGMRDRGLIGADGWLTTDGRAVKARIEALTDDLAAPAYDAEN